LAFALDFTDSHALERSCLDPNLSYDSLSASLGHRPGSRSSLSPRAAESSTLPASPASKPYSSCESVHVTPESPRAHGRSSPGLQPLQSFSLSTLGPSDPPEHEARTRALARRPAPATQRTSSPSRRVRPPCRITTGSSLVGSSQPHTAGPSHLSAGYLPSQPWSDRRSGLPTLRASQ